MNTTRPVILRKRLIPYETVNLSKDILLYRDDELLITKWRTIKPKEEFSGGVSYYFLSKSYKISRFYDHEDRFLYWYCDIIEINYDIHSDTYLVIDLLLDLKLYPDGRVETLDEDELDTALANSLITNEQHDFSKASLQNLLKSISEDRFPPPVCLDERYW